jgi:hypothetical protein
MDRLKTIALCATLLTLASPAFAGWVTMKNEPDPFEPSKSTFVAGDFEARSGLGIRCMQGSISLMLVDVGASNAALGDHAPLKIVVDGQPPRDEDEAIVTTATNETTNVQFGDETTLSYLKGAKKFWVRYTVGGTMQTQAFGGGKSLDDVIQKALKACGK